MSFYRLTSSIEDNLLIKDYDLPDHDKFKQGDIITVNPSILGQTIEGLGFTLNEQTARHLFESDESIFIQLLKNIISLNINFIKLYLNISKDFTDSSEYNISVLNIKNNYIFLILDKILAIKSDIKLIVCPVIKESCIKINKFRNSGKIKIINYHEYSQYLCRYLRLMKYMNYNVYSLSFQKIKIGNRSYYWDPKNLIKFTNKFLKPLLITENKNLVEQIWYGDMNILFDKFLSFKNIEHTDGLSFYGCQCSPNCVEFIESIKYDKDISNNRNQICCASKQIYIMDDIISSTKDILIKTLRNGIQTILYFDFIAMINNSFENEVNNDIIYNNYSSYIFSHVCPFLTKSSRVSYSTNISEKGIFSVSWTCYSEDVSSSREKFICLLLVNENASSKNISVYSSQTDKFLTTLLIPNNTVVTAKIKI